MLKKSMPVIILSLTSLGLISCGQQTTKIEPNSKIIHTKETKISAEKMSKENNEGKKIQKKKPITSQQVDVENTQTSIQVEQQAPVIEKETQATSSVQAINYDIAYQSVFEKYTRFIQLKENNDIGAYQQALSQETSLDNRERFILSHLSDAAPNSVILRYIYRDINHDGKDELVISLYDNVISAVYFLNDDQPQLAATGGVVAIRGGERSALRVYNDGTLAELHWNASSPEGTSIVYKIIDDQLIELERLTYDTTKNEAVMMSSEFQLDPSVETWHVVQQ